MTPVMKLYPPDDVCKLTINKLINWLNYMKETTLPESLELNILIEWQTNKKLWIQLWLLEININ